MNRATRSTLAAALSIITASGQTSSCSGGGSKSTAGGGGGVVNVCKAETKVPTAGFPGRGVIGGYVKLTCPQVPDIFDINVYLNWAVDPKDPTDSEIVDQCYQYDSEQMGDKCTVASACKPGYWSISWKAQVDIDGAAAMNQDTTTYHQVFTEADCKRVTG